MTHGGLRNSRVNRKSSDCSTFLIRFVCPSLVVLLPPFPAPTVTADDSATVIDLARALGAGFSVMPSAHFNVVSNVDSAGVMGLIRAAETTFERVTEFSQRMGFRPPQLSQPMTVVYFNTWPQYEAYAQKEKFVVQEVVPGFFDERGNRCIIFNFENSNMIRAKREELAVAQTEANRKSSSNSSGRRVETRRRRTNELERQINQNLELIRAVVIQHEIAHEVLFNLGLQRPLDHRRRWLKEGLAMQFETTTTPNAHRLADFRDIDWGGRPPTIRSIIEDPTLVGPGAAAPQRAYAAAWALCYYLIQTHPREFERYLRAPPSGGRAGDLEDFAAIFGAIEPLEQNWLEFMYNLH